MAPQKMQAIIDEKVDIKFEKISNSLLMDVLVRCLQRDPNKRITIDELLRHPFLHPTNHIVNLTREYYKLKNDYEALLAQKQ